MKNALARLPAWNNLLLGVRESEGMGQSIQCRAVNK